MDELKTITLNNVEFIFTTWFKYVSVVEELERSQKFRSHEARFCIGQKLFMKELEHAMFVMKKEIVFQAIFGGELLYQNETCMPGILELRGLHDVKEDDFINLILYAKPIVMATHWFRRIRQSGGEFLLTECWIDFEEGF